MKAKECSILRFTLTLPLKGRQHYIIWKSIQPDWHILNCVALPEVNEYGRRERRGTCSCLDESET